MRLDANGFLGVEYQPEGPAWSEGHPLSVVVNQLIGGMIRKAGGFSFQELNLTVDDIAAMSKGGADLSYDFITRPAYHHALLTGDTEFLRLMLRSVHEFGIDPASLIHALQNHDELTLELVHFWTLHADDTYVFAGRTWPGRVLREHLRDTMYESLTGERAPYNPSLRHERRLLHDRQRHRGGAGHSRPRPFERRRPAADPAGPPPTRHVQRLPAGRVRAVGVGPGGGLPLPLSAVADLAAEGDTRWIERGAYDLVDVNPEPASSKAGLPRAPMLYGPISEQLQDPHSFASQLKRLLAKRQSYGIQASHQRPIPDVTNPLCW